MIQKRNLHSGLVDYIQSAGGVGTRFAAGGQTYYVDNNSGADGASGEDWDHALKTLSKAMAVSHANIATGSKTFAKRNTIYLAADSITEDLVLFAHKTDVVGVGAKDSYSMPCIVGNHVPAARGTSTRFFNVQFRCPAAGGVIMTLNSSNEGIQFHGCHFNGWNTIPATIALMATASPRLEVVGCKFKGAISVAAIQLNAGDGNGTIIADNIIGSAGIGIDINASFTCVNEQAYVVDNIINATGLVIDDDADTTIAYIGNRGISAGNFGVTSHDIPAAYSLDNQVTGADSSGLVPSTDQEY